MKPIAQLILTLPLGMTLVMLPLASCAKDSPPVGNTVPSDNTVNISVEQASRLLKDNSAIVTLDVRTPKEFSAGRIPGAVNMDFYARDFGQQLAQLDKDKPYLVHCAVGGRSAKVREQMKQMGFRHIYHLEGGFKAWEAAKLPVQK